MLRTATAAALLFAGIAQAATPSSQTPAAPPASACASAAHRAFDFWIGEWDAYVSGTDQPAGRSSIRREDAGCVITEQWISRRAAFSGRSLNMYDQVAGKWLQFWMDSTGDVTRYSGGPVGGNQMILTAEDDVSPTQLAPRWRRMTFTRGPDGAVRQHGETSTDRGAAWTTEYDFTYRRRP
jgi:hypothetical protein